MIRTEVQRLINEANHSAANVEIPMHNRQEKPEILPSTVAILPKNALPLKSERFTSKTVLFNVSIHIVTIDFRSIFH